MKQIIIPVILAATVVIAGIFAFSPIEEATTVHTAIIADVADDTLVIQEISADAAGLDLDNGDFIRVDCDVPFTILGLIIGEDQGIDIIRQIGTENPLVASHPRIQGNFGVGRQRVGYPRQPV